MGKILNEINIARSEFIIMTKELQRKLRKEIAPFEKSKLSSSVWQMVNSMIPFFILWFLAYQSLSVSYSLESLLFSMIVVTSLFLKTEKQMMWLGRLRVF